MKILSVFVSGLALALLTISPVAAGHGGCCSCTEAPAPTCCAAPASVSFRVDIQETKCQETVNVPATWKAVEKTVEKDVPVTKMVEVCVIDPCTGCKKTECRPETVMQKAKCTTIEIVRVPCTTKVVDKIQSCVNVYMTTAPTCSSCPTCETAAPTCSSCGK